MSNPTTRRNPDEGWGSTQFTPTRSEERLPKYRIAEHPEAPRAPFAMRISQSAFKELLRTLGTMTPEVGVIGFAPKDRMGIDLVEFDVEGSARASRASYDPYVQWIDERRTHHINQPESRMRTMICIGHNHPGSFGQLSGKVGVGLGDQGYGELFIEKAPWMKWFWMPVVTIENGIAVFHPWVLERGKTNRPLIADLVICEASEFPELEYNVAWLASVEKPKAEKRPGITHDASTVGSHSASRKAEYQSRTAGLVSNAFQNKTILTIGVGAGSYAVEKLVRLTPKHVKNCDFDLVELSNLSRTIYTTDDLGEPKVEALSRRLKKVNPYVAVTSYPKSLTDMSPAELNDLFAGVDLVVAGTDQFKAQALVNEQAVRRKIPAVFISVHARGEGGQVAWYVPGETGCFACMAPEKYEADAKPDPNNPIDLAGVPASIIDCQFVDMVASKVVTSILEKGQNSQFGRFYDKMQGRNEVVIRCHPEYAWGTAMWDAVLGDLPAQPKDYKAELNAEAFLSMDTLWLKGRKSEYCAVCGKASQASLAAKAVSAYRAVENAVLGD